LTRSQYYNESGITAARKHTIQWSKSINNELQVLSKASPKSASFSGFHMYIKAYMKSKDALWKEYTNKHWAQQRLRLYGGKKRVFARFYNQLESPGMNTIIAYGSAKFASTGKGEMAVPTTRAYKECTQRFITVPVDEFRSTKVNHRDDTLLQSVKRKDKNVIVRGLLWCSSTNVNKFVNRDLNAAINIRRCLAWGETPKPSRPAILDRSKCVGALEQTIGKYIKC
jgi:transposase